MENKGSEAARSGNGLILAGAAIAALMAAGVFMSTRDPANISGDDVVATVAPRATAPVEDVVEPTPEETAPDATQKDEQDEDAPPAPRIDEVRVDGSGILVVAGRAVPGSTVEVLVDGGVVTAATADADGAFAALATLDASVSARTLTLREVSGGAARLSDEEIILAPIDIPVARTTDTDEPAQDETDLAALALSEEQSADVGQETAAQVDGGANAQSVITDESQENRAEQHAQATPQALSRRQEQVGNIEDADTASARDRAPSEPGPVAADDDAGDATVTAGLATDQSDTGAATGGLPASEADTQLVADRGTGPLADAGAAQAANDTAPVPQDAIRPEASPADPPEAGGQIAVLRSDSEGVTLAQTAPASTVVLDTIGYSATGEVEISGRAEIGTVEIRAYLNNRVVARLPVDEAGRWRGAVPDVDAGVYTLRVDSLAADGSVESRIETPFKREEPAVLAEATAAAAGGAVRAVTVQAGDTLWAIARERYGEGLLYVQVFEANRGAIRDPDLIFPGQVFDLPAD